VGDQVIEREEERGKREEGKREKRDKERRVGGGNKGKVQGN
jgi:hypothetical protein